MLERFLSWVLGIDQIVAEEKLEILSERLRCSFNAVSAEAFRYSLRVTERGAR